MTIAVHFKEGTVPGLQLLHQVYRTLPYTINLHTCTYDRHSMDTVHLNTMGHPIVTGMLEGRWVHTMHCSVSGWSVSWFVAHLLHNGSRGHCGWGRSLLAVNLWSVILELFLLFQFTLKGGDTHPQHPHTNALVHTNTVNTDNYSKSGRGCGHARGDTGIV